MIGHIAVQQAAIGSDNAAISELMKKQSELKHLKLAVLTRRSMGKEEIIDASELKEALRKCIIVANEECFPDDITAIRSGKQINRNYSS